MNKQLKVFLYKILFFALPILFLYEVFLRSGLYPILSDSEIFDLKMIYMQKRHINNIKIMAIGSSVTLYGLEDSVIARNFNSSFYNMAGWGWQIAEDEALSRDWVKKYEPKYIIMCSAIGDFQKLSNDAKMITYGNTPDFIKTNFLEYFYVKNYSSISSLIKRRFFPFLPLKIAIPDRWGGSLALYLNQKRQTNAWSDSEDKIPNQYTEGNYRSLGRLAANLKQANVKFIFIQAPMSNSRSGELSYKQMLTRHFKRCKSIVEAENGIYLNYYNPKIFTDSLFYDKYHLYTPGTHLLTTEIIKDLKNIIR